jgi:alpha,alpha-trehalose phosphorylase
MIDREIKLPPNEYYPVEPWRFVQAKLDKNLIGRDEAIFATSNGYIGIRGSFEEGEPIYQKATFVSGFHETWPIEYGEEAYGFAKTGQTMIPVTEACTLKLFVDDEPFSLRHAYVKDDERALNFKDGIRECDSPSF